MPISQVTYIAGGSNLVVAIVDPAQSTPEVPDSLIFSFSHSHFFLIGHRPPLTPLLVHTPCCLFRTDACIHIYTYYNIFFQIGPVAQNMEIVPMVAPSFDTRDTLVEASLAESFSTMPLTNS